MPKTLQGLQTNFTAGCLSPRLWGHVDAAKYKNGIKVGENVYCLPHGPIVRRTGTELIAEVKDSTKEVRLVRFQFNQDNAFILEFGDQYIRFYKDGGQLLSGAAITNGTFGTDLTGWTDDDTGTGASTQAAGVMSLAGGAAGVAARTQGIEGFGSGTYTLSFDVGTNPVIYRVGTTKGGTEVVSGTAAVGHHDIVFTPTVSGTFYIQFRNPNNNTGTIDNVTLDTPIYEIPTTYTETEVQELTYVQYGRAVYIAHENHPPAILTFTDDANWSLEDAFFYPPPTDEDGLAPSSISITLSATTGLTQTATASSAIFLPSDVGRQLQNTAGAGSASIVGYTSTTVVTIDILEDFPSTAIGTGEWKLDLSPIAKLEMDQSSTGTTCTLSSYYLDSYRGPAQSITSITIANPAVVTVTGHGLTDGDKVELKNIQGMPQINNSIWAVNVLTADTFNLLDVNGDTVDSTLYTAYTGNGTIRRVYTDISIDAFRSSTDVGKYIIINGGIGLITDVTNGHVAKVELQKSLNSLTSTSAWSMEQEAWTASKGYPRTVSLHQQRIWYGGTDSAPQTVWSSSAGVFDSIGVGPGEDDAVQFDLASAQVNQIQWMYGLRDQLVIGTSGAEVTISAGTNGASISPVSVTADSRTYCGSKLQQPVSLENEVIYVQRSGTKINSFRYNFEIDNFLSEDLAFLAEHLPNGGGGVKELAYAQDPDRLIYAILNDGTMMVGSYYRDQQVMAWTLYSTEGSYENVQTISTGLADEVWVVVNRTIDGSTKRYIERFPNYHMATWEDSNIQVFSDCCLTLSSPITVSGITKANPGVVTATAHGLNNGDYVKMFNVEGMTEVNGRTYIVANKTANTFELTTTSGSNVNTTSYGTYTSGGSLYKLFTTVSGLDHLEGCTVQVKADGSVHPDCVVSSGSITLDGRAYEVTVGLPYTSTITTLQREIQGPMGSQQGQPVRHIHPILRLYKSALPALDGEFAPARTPQDLMDNRVALSTGDIEYGSLYWSTNSELTMTISDPYPFALLGIFGSIETGVR